MSNKKELVKRVKGWFWYTDSDDTDNNSQLEWASDNDCAEIILQDETNDKFYRIDNHDVDSLKESDIVEVKPYDVMITRFR